MSTMGRQEDEYARQLRAIRKRAEKAAEEYTSMWLTGAGGVRIEQGGQVVRLSHEEAKRLAKGVCK